MSLDIIQLFEILQPETAPRHLPTGDTAYKYVWSDTRTRDDWKADGYRWRNQGAFKKLKNVDGDVRKTFFHVRMNVVMYLITTRAYTTFPVFCRVLLRATACM